MMQPSNVILVPVDKDNVYRYWLKFVAPVINLTNKEFEVGVLVMERYAELLDKSNGFENVIEDNLICKEFKERICSSLRMKMNNVEVVLSHLREKGFLVKNMINKRYIPNFDANGKMSLLILYDVRR